MPPAKYTAEELAERRREQNRRWWANQDPAVKAARLAREAARGRSPENLAKRAAQMRAKRAADPEKVRAAERLRRAKDPEKWREVSRQWYADRPEHARALARARTVGRYGLTVPQWDAMFEAQGRRCACCGTDDPGSRKRWHTDHCHDTGRVRGILCSHCNISIGQLGDNAPSVRAACARFLAYLEKP